MPWFVLELVYNIIMNDNKDMCQTTEDFEAVKQAMIAELRKEDPDYQPMSVEEYKKYLDEVMS